MNKEILSLFFLIIFLLLIPLNTSSPLLGWFISGALTSYLAYLLLWLRNPLEGSETFKLSIKTMAHPIWLAIILVWCIVASISSLMEAFGSIAGIAFFLSPIIGFFVFSRLIVSGAENLKAADSTPLGKTITQHTVTYELDRPGTVDFKRSNGVAVVYDTYAVIDDFSFNGKQIQWLGDRIGRDEVVLDLDVDGRWFTLTIHAGKSAKALLDDLRELTPAHIDTARNRRRPNRRYPPIAAFTTTQNLQGIWHNHEAVRLLLTPLWFVVLRQDRVVNTIAIDDVQNIQCIKHPTALDDAALLLQFDTTKNEQFAFSITDATFPEQLAQVTREAIDDVPLQKTKHEESDLS